MVGVRMINMDMAILFLAAFIDQATEYIQDAAFDAKQLNINILHSSWFTTNVLNKCDLSIY